MRRFGSCACAIGVLAVLGCGEAAPPSVAAAPTNGGRPAVAVEVARVASDTLRTTIAATGSVEARRSSEIAPEVPGRLVEIYVDFGDVVAEGDPLFRVEPTPYEMALSEARAALSLAVAEWQNARSEAERVQKLAARDVASRQQLDRLQTQAQVASARVEQMRARRERAERDVERTLVRSPYAASVVERRADEGAMGAADPVLVLQETGALEATLNVPEASPVPVAVGDPVRLYVQGRADPIRTVVARVSDRIDAETRTYRVRVVVDDPEGHAKAGSYVRAEIEVTRDSVRPVVPRAALLLLDGRTYVFRAAGERAERVPVRVGVEAGERVEILSGLEPGDLLVSGDVVQRLSDGARIERADLRSSAEPTRVEAKP